MADTTVKLKADISQLKSQMQAAARQVKLANSEFKAASAGMDSWSDNAEGLQAKLKQLTTTLSSQKTQLSLLEKEYEKTKEAYGENSAAADKVKVSINNMKAAIKTTESQISQYTQDLKDCENGEGRFADETEEMTQSVEDAGDGFTVFKGVLADLVATAITTAISALKDLAQEVVETGSAFEKSMSNVQAISGATDDELQLLTDTAKEFGSTTQFSASEAADALSYMALAGWDAETSAEALGGVLDLAAASGMELAEASDMVTDYLSAFSMSASESTYLADLLSYAQSNANTTAEQLGEAFGNTAANMNAAGQDIETTTALLSSMANQGLKGSEAGTALAAVLRDISQKMKTMAADADTAELAEEGLVSITGDLNDVLGKNYIEIGNTLIPVSDLSGNYRDLTDILKDVETATDGLGEAEKSTALQTTFTSKSIKGVNLILNDGVDNAAAFEEELRNCSGTASDMAKVMNDNLSGDLTALNSKIEGVKITVYESLAPALRKAVEEISNTIDGVDWEKVGQQVGDLTVKAVELLTKIIQHSDGVVDILKAIGTTLGTAFVVSKVLTFVSSIITMYKTFQTLKTATEAATTAQLLLNAAEAASPVGLVVAGVAALAAGLIYLASQTKEEKKQLETLNEWEQKEVDKVNELRQSYYDMAEARQKTISDIGKEYDYYEELADELDTLVDANGEVKEGYEDRVNFILTTLNDAVGTEMELVDGVIQNYQDEKSAIESLIETKKAEAVLSATQEDYTQAIKNRSDALDSLVTTTGIFNQNVKDMTDAEAAYNAVKDMTTDEYIKANDLMVSETTAAEMLRNEINTLSDEYLASKAAVGESRVAMENAKKTYEGYNATIKNYEGLSSAIISGDADKISEALTNLQYDFQTAETSTKSSLEQQVRDYEDNLEALKTAIQQGTPSVTQDMVDQAQAMVDAAKEELNKLPADAELSANDAAKKYATALGSESNKKLVLESANGLQSSANTGLEPKNDEPKTAGDNFTAGYIAGMEIKIPVAKSTASGLGSSAVTGLDEGQESHSPSAATYRSGENFGQGFINGMNSKTNSIWSTAWNLAKTALNALKSGQQEGSPSKLTFKSGTYFTQGYINGITSLEKQLQNTVKGMVKVAVNEAMNVKNYSFSSGSQGVADQIADQLSSQTTYMINRITYNNEKKTAEFDAQITKLKNAQTKKTDKIQAASDKKVAALQKKKDKATDDAEKAKIDKQIAAEKKSAAKLIKAQEDKYSKLIATQEKYKTAYQNASAEFISEFSTAINDYSSKAQDLINSTIQGIGDKYQAKYDELIAKQDTLINKLKSAGSLFEVSGAGIMTVNDIKAQTKQITDYTNKLNTIKQKVSQELFDEIASYDMKEGSAFIDQLLSMSTSDLSAYNKAYTEKMQAAEKAGQTIYGKEIENVKSEYEKELNAALKSLPKQLEELGEQTMKGFVEGLTKNTDYMSTEVQTFIASMIGTFKKELGIASPSKVMMKIGDFTGIGLANGLKGTINEVKKTASSLASAVASPIDAVSADIGSIKAGISGSGSNGAVATSNTVNNYNLVQNNTSPKSLSALETYQARRQQIAMIKAATAT